MHDQLANIVQWRNDYIAMRIIAHHIWLLVNQHKQCYHCTGFRLIEKLSCVRSSALLSPFLFNRWNFCGFNFAPEIFYQSNVLYNGCKVFFDRSRYGDSESHHHGELPLDRMCVRVVCVCVFVCHHQWNHYRSSNFSYAVLSHYTHRTLANGAGKEIVLSSVSVA